MVMLAGAFSNNLAPGFRKVVFETYKERKTEGNALVNMTSSKRAYEDDFNMAGFDTLVKKIEGGSITYQDALQLYTKRYLWTTFGKGFRITQELMEDDLYGVFGTKMSKALGRAARNNFEVVAHAPYNSAFDTSVVGFNAGESLCDASHALGRGGTAISNTAAVDFGLLGLQAAFEHFHALNDESGLPVVFIPRTVVYSIGDHWMVNQVLKSQQLPGGDQNDINQVANEGMGSHLSHFIIDGDAWWVLADNHDVNYFDRRSPTFSNSDDFDSGDAKFKLTRRNGSGFGDWRGIYGSAGG